MARVAPRIHICLNNLGAASNVGGILWSGGKYMPRSRQMAGDRKTSGKKVNRQWEKTKESINRESMSQFESKRGRWGSNVVRKFKYNK